MNTRTTTPEDPTFDLAAGELLAFDGRPGQRLQVLAGGLWLTEARHLEDRFAGAGEWLRLEARGRAVAEALGPSRVRLVEPAPQAHAQARVRRWRLPRADALAWRSLAVVMSLLVGIGLPEMLARGLQGTALAPQAGVTAAAMPGAPQAG
jgi:hypothetical protein